MAKQDDGLFLLEVLIDKIVFVKSPCFSDKEFRTCVNVECPAVEPLEICDDDPGACFAKSGGPFVKTFNSGKSCLFSLKEAEISKAMSKFPIKISVYKSLPCGCLPTKIVLGEATIDMTKEFVQARKKFVENPGNVSYEALKDAFRIVGADGGEAGEIVMFLRISCFGKLIVTRFQGGGPPNLGGAESSTIVDRSCNPRKDFQTVEDPCACGAARGLGSGCPHAKDPYNSVPCEDPDDPCYCSGAKSTDKQQMACRNTDQYCLHVPKGITSSKMNDQGVLEDMKVESSVVDFSKYTHMNRRRVENSCNEKINSLKLPQNNMRESSELPIDTVTSKYQSLYYSESSHDFLKTDVSSEFQFAKKSIFDVNETTVYLTLLGNTKQSSATQATASVNKCLQVCSKQSTMPENLFSSNLVSSDSNNWSTCTASTCPYKLGKLQSTPYTSDVYFFGKKRDNNAKMGMGSSDSNTMLKRSGQAASASVKSQNGKNSAFVQAQSEHCCAAAQTKKSSGSNGTSTCKAVSIRDDKSEKSCPAIGSTKGDMVATISHIKIGPREPCPVHGRDPCQGPKCVVAGSSQDHAPVKVTTVTNSRRGVFELVIRQISGAPLAKNELMLEWTPPPFRLPCGSPCPVPCTIPTICRPPKCKMIICRPSRCKTKCKGKRPCGPVSSALPKKCRKPCCGSPCSRSISKSRSPSPCKNRCGSCKSPCNIPCSSSPCLRPCPVSSRKPHRSRSQPRMKPHKKRVSPCFNRLTACPVLQCNNFPRPYIINCSPCPIRTCCSISSKAIKCCNSICSKCC